MLVDHMLNPDHEVLDLTTDITEAYLRPILLLLMRNMGCQAVLNPETMQIALYNKDGFLIYHRDGPLIEQVN